jgi:hypothetical protein
MDDFKKNLAGAGDYNAELLKEGGFPPKRQPNMGSTWS